MSVTRGIRLNNPGNIEKGAKWQGLSDLQPDSRFASFIAPEYGIRALVKILRTYHSKHKLTTIKQWVTRWAPGHENPTDKYIENVAKWSGIAATATIDPKDRSQMAAIAKAFIRQENGVQPYPEAIITLGVDLGIKA